MNDNTIPVTFSIVFGIIGIVLVGLVENQLAKITGTAMIFLCLILFIGLVGKGVRDEIIEELKPEVP